MHGRSRMYDHRPSHPKGRGEGGVSLAMECAVCVLRAVPVAARGSAGVVARDFWSW